MKYTSASVIAATAIIASVSVARADTASDIANCLQEYNCGNDVNCVAKCMPSAAPSESEVTMTNNCINTSCANEAGYSGTTDAACQEFCVNKYFLAGNTNNSTSSGSDSSSENNGNSDGSNDQGLENSAFTNKLSVLITVASGAAAAVFAL